MSPLAVLCGSHQPRPSWLTIRTSPSSRRYLRARRVLSLRSRRHDGDHQHDPNDIPRLVETILSGKSDLVIGVRWGKTSGMPIYRRMGKRALDYATAAAAKRGLLTDSQSGYRVFSRQALECLEPTEKGHAAWDRTVGTQAERERRIASVLTGAEREQLHRLLRKLMAAFPDRDRWYDTRAGHEKDEKTAS